MLVPCHVLLLDGNGKTIVDTDDRKADRRKVQGVWVVEGYQAKANQQFKWNRELDLKLGVPERWAGRTMGDLHKDEIDDYVAWIHEKREKKAREKQAQK